jgi:hypothetical protein
MSGSGRQPLRPARLSPARHMIRARSEPAGATGSDLCAQTTRADEATRSALEGPAPAEPRVRL